MKRIFFDHIKIFLLVLLTVIVQKAIAVTSRTSSGEAAADAATQVYDSENPLVVGFSWSSHPYSFNDEQGYPTGFEVDVVKAVLGRLKVPYIIRLEDRKKWLSEGRAGHYGLCLGSEDNFGDSAVFYSNSAASLVNSSVAYPKGKKLIYDFSDLARIKVLVLEDGFIANEMKKRGWEANAINVQDVKDALFQIARDERGQIVANSLTLEWLVKKYHLDNIVVEDIKAPQNKHAFASADKALLHQIDSVFSIMDSHSELNDIYDKWNHKEADDDDKTLYFWIAVSLLLAIITAALVIKVIYSRWEKKAARTVRLQNKRLIQMLRAADSDVWTYDVETQTFTEYNKDLEKTKETTWSDKEVLYSSKDYNTLHKAMYKLVNKVSRKETFHQNVNVVEGAEEKIIEVNLSVLESHDGRPAVIVGVEHDISKERRQMKEDEFDLSRYKSIFEESLMDVAIFDNDGKLKTMNKRLCRALGAGSPDEMVKKGLGIADFKPFGFIDTTSEDTIFYTTSDEDNKFYDVTYLPIFDDDGNKIFCAIQSTDITNEINYYHKHRDNTRRLQKAMEEREDIMSKVDYAIQQSNTRIAVYDPDKRTFTSYRNVGVPRVIYSELQMLAMVHQESFDLAINLFSLLDKKDDVEFTETIKTTLRREDGNDTYLEFNVAPAKDKDGNVDHYFGSYNDVTDLMDSKEKLEEERKKALEAETVKSSFLKNMSYELRTPLNTVVGFAELLGHGESKADEEFFVNSIKKNTDKLLQLINNALYISRLDANTIGVKRRPLDFAAFFDRTVKDMWKEHGHEGVRLIISNPYKHITAEIDPELYAKIIDNLISNAAKFTIAGAVRATYEYHGGNLTVTIEDTGRGIDSESQKKVFERFFKQREEKGTGLGLPICKEIVELMNGRIGVESTLGQGTMVWFSIPCVVSESKKKELKNNG